MKITCLAVLILLAGWVFADWVTEGLIIHLDAGSITDLSDGDEVTSWADSATADTVDGSVTLDDSDGSPTYETGELNGQPIVRFVRTEEDALVSSVWTLPDPSQGVTIFVVCTGGDSGSVERVMQIGASAGTASHLVAADVSSGTSGSRYNNGYSLTSSADNPVTAGQYHISIRQMAQGGRHDSLYYAVDGLDAETLNCNNPSNTITFDDDDNHLSVGGGVDTTGVWYPDFFNGDLAEILVYNAQLSAAQIAQTAEYLSDKYDLSFSSAAVLIDEGDDDTTAVKEGDDTDTLSVSLTLDPGDYEVTVDVVDALDPNQVTVTPSQLVFTSDNWQTAQAISVAAIDDEDMERYEHETQLAWTVTTDSASVYDGAEVDDLTVTIEDNDCGSWGFSTLDYNLDCRVNLEDFAWFALAWVECSEPDSSCQDFE